MQAYLTSQSDKGLINSANVKIDMKKTKAVNETIFIFLIFVDRVGSSSTIGNIKIEAKTPTINPPTCPQLSIFGVTNPYQSPVDILKADTIKYQYFFAPS